jgi:hypothetical protein
LRSISFRGDRATVLLEEIAEGLIDQVQEVDYAVLGQAIDRVPGLDVEECVCESRCRAPSGSSLASSFTGGAFTRLGGLLAGGR